MRSLAMMICLAMVGCGGGEEPGWDLGDEMIVIWTIPRPGEAETTAASGTPGESSGEQPQTPAAPPTPPQSLEPEPSVSPVSCDAEFPLLTVPGKLEGALARGRGVVQEMPCAISPGAERRFTLNVPRRMGVELRTEYGETEFPPVLMLQAGCGDETLDGYCSSPLRSRPQAYSSLIRAVLEPGRYTLILDERNLLDYGEGGNFVLHAEEFELDENAMCETPDQLWPDNIGVVATVDRGSTGDWQGCFGASRSRHFWTMQVPPGQSYRVRAVYDDPEIQHGPHIEIRNGCYDDCDGHANSDMVSVGNDTAESVSYVVGVSDSRGEPYRVFVETTASISENASCEMAEYLPAGTTTVGDLIAGSEHTSLCGHNDTRQLFYRVDVPPQHRLIPQARGGTAAVHPYCGAEQCLQNPVNESGVTQSYVVAMGDLSGVAEAFELTANVVPVASNSTCLAPQALNSGSPIRGSLVNGGLPAGSCGLVHAVGYTLWYSLEIPPMSAIRVDVRGDEEFSSLALEAMLDGCGGACLGSYDPYLRGPGDPNVELTNDGNTPMLVWLAVTSEEQHADEKAFELEVSSL